MATGTSLPSGRRRRSTRVPGKHASFSTPGACGAAKAISQDIRVIAVQSEAAPAAYRSWKTRTLVEDEMRTFAEGLATRVPFELPQTILWSLLDGFVLVSEDELRAAMVRMIEATRNLVEAAGAASLAAALRLAPTLEGKRVAMVCSGGNVSIGQFRELVEVANSSSLARERPSARRFALSPGRRGVSRTAPGR